MRANYLTSDEVQKAKLILSLSDQNRRMMDTTDYYTLVAAVALSHLDIELPKDIFNATTCILAGPPDL